MACIRRWQSGWFRMPMRMKLGRPKEEQSRTNRPDWAKLSRQAAASDTSTSRKLAAEGGTLNSRVVKLFDQVVLGQGHFGPGAVQVVGILQGGGGGGLGRAVNAPVRLVVGQPGGDLRGGDRVADAQAGEGVGFGHRPQDNDISQGQETLGVLWAVPGIVHEIRVGPRPGPASPQPGRRPRPGIRPRPTSSTRPWDCWDCTGRPGRVGRTRWFGRFGPGPTGTLAGVRPQRR